MKTLFIRIVHEKINQPSRTFMPGPCASSAHLDIKYRACARLFTTCNNTCVDCTPAQSSAQYHCDLELQTGNPNWSVEQTVNWIDSYKIGIVRRWLPFLQYLTSRLYVKLRFGSLKEAGSFINVIWNQYQTLLQMRSGFLVRAPMLWESPVKSIQNPGHTCQTEEGTNG